MNRTSGFTLVEILVSVLISAVILEAIYTMVLLGQKAWNDYANNLLPKQEIRRSLISLTSELREAKDPVIEENQHSTNITFERPEIGTVSYSWSNEGANAYQIIRTNNDQQRIIARDITSLSFKAPIDDEVQISVSSGKKQRFTLMEGVALRAKTGLFLQGQNEAVK